MRHAFMGHINSLTLYNIVPLFQYLCYGFVFLFISCNSIHVGDSIISLRVLVIFVLAYLCHNFPFFLRLGFSSLLFRQWIHCDWNCSEDGIS